MDGHKMKSRTKNQENHKKLICMRKKEKNKRTEKIHKEIKKVFS